MEEFDLTKLDKDFQTQTTYLRKFTRHSRIWLGVILFSTASFCALAYWLYTSISLDTQEDYLIRYSRSMAATSASRIDPVQHQQALAGGTGSPEYRQIKDVLDGLRSILPGADAHFTLVVDSDRVQPGIAAGENAAVPAAAAGALQAKINAGNIDLSKAFVLGRSRGEAAGSSIGCSPQSTAGSTLVLYCAGMNADTAYRITGSARQLLFTNLVLSAGLCILIAFSVGLHRRQVRTCINRLRDQRDLYIRTAHSDPLTGALNRRSFDLIYPLAEAQLRRHDLPFAVIAVDIDHFKSINDTWGHDTGDKVLTETVQTLRSHLRSSDYLARMGGEEFLILCSVAKGEAAHMVAEKLRHAIASMAVYDDHGQVIRITVSLGVYLARHGDTRSEVLKRADTALYEAKQGGRNTTVLYQHDSDIMHPQTRSVAGGRA